MNTKKATTSLTMPTAAGPSDWHARQEKAASEAAALSRNSSIKKGQRPTPPTASTSVKRQRTQSSSVKSRSPYPSASPSLSQHQQKKQRHASPLKMNISPSRPSPEYRSSSSPDPLQMMPAPRIKPVVSDPSRRMAISSLVGPSKGRMSLGEGTQSRSRLSTPFTTRLSPRQPTSSTKRKREPTPFDVISISDDEEDEPPPRRLSPVKRKASRRRQERREQSKLSETPPPQRDDPKPAVDPKLMVSPRNRNSRENDGARQARARDKLDGHSDQHQRPSDHSHSLSPDFPPADPITEPSPIRRERSSVSQTRTPLPRPHAPRRSTRSSGSKPARLSDSEQSDHEPKSSTRSLRNRVIRLESSPSPSPPRQPASTSEAKPETPTKPASSAVRRKRMLLEVAIPRVTTPIGVRTPRATRAGPSQPTPPQAAQSPKVTSAPRVTRAKAAEVEHVPAVRELSPRQSPTDQQEQALDTDADKVAELGEVEEEEAINDTSSDVFIDALEDHISPLPEAEDKARDFDAHAQADAVEEAVMKSPTPASPGQEDKLEVTESAKGEGAILQKRVLTEAAATEDAVESAEQTLSTTHVDMAVAEEVPVAENATLSTTGETAVYNAPELIADDPLKADDNQLPSDTQAHVEVTDVAELPSISETTDPHSSLGLDVDSMLPDVSQVSGTYAPPTEPADELADMLQYVHEDAYVDDGSKANGDSPSSPLSPISKLIKARDEANAQFARQAKLAPGSQPNATSSVARSPLLPQPTTEPEQSAAVSPSDHAQPVVAALEAAVARAQAVHPVKTEKRARRSNAGTTANAREVEKMVADWLQRMNEPEDGAPVTLPVHLTTLSHAEALSKAPVPNAVDTKPSLPNSDADRIETPGWTIVKPAEDDEEEDKAVGESLTKLRHRGTEEENAEDTSDERYAAAHKRYESFERRQRIREKEKLHFERHLMRTKLDILKGMPPSSWSAIVNGALQRSEEAGASKLGGAAEQLIRDNGVDWLKSRLIAEGQEVIERYDQLLPVESRHKKTQGAPNTLSVAGTPPPVLPSRVNALRGPPTDSASKKTKQSSPVTRENLNRLTPSRKTRAVASPSSIQPVPAASVVSDGDPPTAEEITAARAKASLKQRAALAAARQVEEDPFIPITTASGLPCLVEAANKRYAAMEEHEAAKASGKTVGPQRSSSRAAQIMPFGAAPPAILGWKMNYDLDGQLWWDMLEERRLKREKMNEEEERQQ